MQRHCSVAMHSPQDRPVIQAALLVAITGALTQSLWNGFSPSKGGASGPARPLKDFDTFGGAASDSWGSPRLLWRTKGL